MNQVTSYQLKNKPRTKIDPSISNSWLSTVFVIAASLFSWQTQAAEISSESEQLIKDLQQKIQSTVAAIAEIENSSGNSAKDLHILIDLPAKYSPNLGMVLDLESIDNGYKVLSITPGSLAANLNVAPGDLITTINGISIEGSNKRKAFEQLENVLPGDRLELQLNKNGKAAKISTLVKGRYSPSVKLEIGTEPSATAIDTPDETELANECGTVSVFFTPPETKRLYSAYVSKINDRGVIRSKESFRLKPGKHTIYLHELIDDPFFKRRHRGLQRAKPLEIDVKANTTYYLAAKFIKDKAFKQRKGEYWEPVIWKETQKGVCEL